MGSRLFKAAFCFAFVALFCAIACAEAPKFKEGDRVCFVGDSITHGGSYHYQVLLFYVTRFPQMTLSAWNCGISGDSAVGGVRRYAWDIAPHKATVATIMMGMNDIGRHLYAEGKSGKDVETQRQGAIDGSNANVDKLAGILAKDGTSIIFITPSLYDQTGNQKNDKQVGVNDALKACGESDKKLAEKYKGGLVDFNGPMEALNKEGQAKDPDFTIVGPDRVHPGPIGHLVMAYLFLKEQGVFPTVAEMELDASKSEVLKQDNCEISKVSAKDGAISFECLEKSLPFPISTSTAKALELVPLTNDLNKETLKVSGLPEGNYEVLIDGQPAVKATASSLKDGVNLALVVETPQYKQALEVQKILNARADIERKLRNFAQIEHGFLSSLKERSPEADRKAIEEKLEKLRTTEGKQNKYYIGVYETYLKFIPEKESFERQVDEALVKAYAASKPVSHLYEIRPVR